MSYFDVFASIFEKSAMTDLPKVIVSICLVSYNICMIPHVWGLTFGLNLSGAWGGGLLCDCEIFVSSSNVCLGNYLKAADLARGLSWDSVMVAARPQMKE